MGVDIRFFDLDHPFMWTVPGVLSPTECAALVANAEASAEWLPGTINGAEGRVVRRDIRNNSVALLDDTALGAALLEWVRAPARMSGRTLAGMKERLRIYRYEPGEMFGLHRDQKYRGPNGERSELALLLYLNEGFEGGHTVFPELREDIAPRTGTAVVFQNMTLHAGEPVTSGTRYVLRGDVFYG